MGLRLLNSISYTPGMRAIIFEGNEIRFDPGQPLPQPREGELLVRVTLAGICATDLEIVKGYMGFEGVLGHEFVGAVAASADSPLAGRRVAGEINISCGTCQYCRAGLPRHCPSRSVLGIAGKNGAFAEYITLPADNLHPVPEDISDEEAVFIEPLAAAFEIVEQVDVEAGDSVCVLGDGRLGLLAAQVLSLSTENLLALGRHPEKLAILEKRGIRTGLYDEVKEKFDLVIDCTGSSSGIGAALSLVKPRGVIVLKTTVADPQPVDLNRLVIDEVTLTGSRCGPFAPAINALQKRQVDVLSLISRKFPLEKGAEALRYAAREGVMKVLLEVGINS